MPYAKRCESASDRDRTRLRQLQFLCHRFRADRAPFGLHRLYPSRRQWSRIVLYPRRQPSRSGKDASRLWQTDAISSSPYSRGSSAARGSDPPHRCRGQGEDAFSLDVEHHVAHRMSSVDRGRCLGTRSCIKGKTALDLLAGLARTEFHIALRRE